MMLNKPYDVYEQTVVTGVRAKVLLAGREGDRTEMVHTFKLYAPLPISDEVPAHGYVCIGLQPGTAISIPVQHVTEVITEKRFVRREAS